MLTFFLSRSHTHDVYAITAHSRPAGESTHESRNLVVSGNNSNIDARTHMHVHAYIHAETNGDTYTRTRQYTHESMHRCIHARIVHTCMYSFPHACTQVD